MSEEIVLPAEKLRGRILVPADKSISHRALILGSLAKGTTKIENLLDSEDVLSTEKCLRSLGINIEKKDGFLYVEGKGKHGFIKPEEHLDVGNSGTTLRILPGILAGQDFEVELSGDTSVNSRPMERVLKPLRKMGAQAFSTDGHAPVKIQGSHLRGIEYHTEVPSAQIKSAILLAGLFAQGNTAVIEDYKSRDHTELMLKSFGADITVDGNKVTVSGEFELSPQKVKVPGDFSSAAFFIAAGILVPNSIIELENVGINPNRTGMANVLMRMGCDILLSSQRSAVNSQQGIIRKRIECGERVADIVVSSHKLQATSIEKPEIPSLIDELPVIAVLASQAEGRTVVSGAEELRVKETDRIMTIVTELSKMGAQIEETEDGFVVEGPVKLKGAQVDSHGDHRLAMSLAVAGLVAEGETLIKQADAVNISFPGFFKVLESLSYDNCY